MWRDVSLPSLALVNDATEEASSMSLHSDCDFEIVYGTLRLMHLKWDFSRCILALKAIICQAILIMIMYVMYISCIHLFMWYQFIFTLTTKDKLGLSHHHNNKIGLPAWWSQFTSSTISDLFVPVGSDSSLASSSGCTVSTCPVIKSHYETIAAHI